MAIATGPLNDCTQLDASALERVNYFPRQLLTADDMTADQQYFIAKLRRHNRYLHGWGVVCGMEITVAPTANSPWQVQIGSGYALGPYGDEIYIPNPVMLDLAQCGPGASTDPCDPASLLQTGVSKAGTNIFIAVRYEECFARPVRVMPGGCGCSDSTCEPSRISDSFEIECLGDLPPSAQPGPAGPSLCDIITGQALAQCPPCPTDPWVVLAQVKLPGVAGTQLTQAQIDNVTVRRKVFSTAAIQEQVRVCCCTGKDRAPARVTSITPANGAVFNARLGPAAIVITFDKHLTGTTVNTKSILVERTSVTGASAPVKGAVTYDDSLRAAQFKPAAGGLSVAGEYLVTVVGSGPSQILDSDNLALDGNDDGVAGGNFISQFSVGTQVPPTPAPSTPLKLLVKGPQPTPQVRPSPSVALGVVSLALSEGTPGKKTLGDVTVTLSAPIAATVAGQPRVVLTDDAGNQVAGAKAAGTSPRVYTFKKVTINEPGPTGTQAFTIENMRVDASNVAAGTITAAVSIATADEGTLTGEAPLATINRG